MNRRSFFASIIALPALLKTKSALAGGPIAYFGGRMEWFAPDPKQAFYRAFRSAYPASAYPLCMRHYKVYATGSISDFEYQEIL